MKRRRLTASEKPVAFEFHVSKAPATTTTSTRALPDERELIIPDFPAARASPAA